MKPPKGTNQRPTRRERSRLLQKAAATAEQPKHDPKARAKEKPLTDEELAQ